MSLNICSPPSRSQGSVNLPLKSSGAAAKYTGTPSAGHKPDRFPSRRRTKRMPLKIRISRVLYTKQTGRSKVPLMRNTERHICKKACWLRRETLKIPPPDCPKTLIFIHLKSFWTLKNQVHRTYFSIRYLTSKTE